MPVTSTSVQSRQRGQVMVMFALMLPMFLALGGVVIGIGNWYVHGKNLQTKADAGAFAGGSSWSFPCVGTATDQVIADQARQYAGPTTATPSGANPQVGGVPSSSIHTVLNGSDFYDDDTPTNPAAADWTSPTGSVCDARILNVKVTEDNSFPLASLIPLFPDIKREATVRIEEQEGSSGLLPIAVRVPKAVSAAAIYVNETPGANYGNILSARYFKDICEPPAYSDCNGTIPTALDQWTTDDGSVNGNPADISSMPAQTGVVIALSFRPKCPGPAPCFDITSATDITTLCNQGSGAGTAQCYYTTASGGNQVFRSGLQFINSYSPPTSDNAPEIGRVWLEPISGTNCTHGYFSAPVANSCIALLQADVDVPNYGAGSGVEVRYKMVSGGTSWQEDDAPGGCNANYGVNCDVPAGGASVEFVPQYARHAFVIRVRPHDVVNPVALGLPLACASGPNANCEWFFTGAGRVPPGGAVPTNQQIFDNPLQRAFMGNIDRSGSVKFLHMYDVDCTSGGTIAGAVTTSDAASVQTGRRCFKMEMGLQGALAREQDEDPIQLNIGATSQSAIVDCDPNLSNLKDEIATGCQSPTYKKHDFAAAPYCPTVSGANQFFGTTSWNGTAWPPFQCVLTQTSATPNQVIQGFNERFFNDPTSPSCPADNAQFVPGRNYWHDYNNEFTGDPDGSGPEPSQADYFTFVRSSRNHPNKLRTDDPRFVLLFITPYNSFTGQGNETYPISLIGGFYITGYGTINGSGNFTNEDPCDDGSVGGGTTPTSPYAGNTPPPDLDTSTAGAVAWGHFVVPVDLGGSSGGTGTLCEPGTPTACVAILIK